MDQHAELRKIHSFYEAIFIDQNTAFAIGSASTLLKISISANQNFNAKNQ